MVVTHIAKQMGGVWLLDELQGGQQVTIAEVDIIRSG
jgi:hypothetical protein